MKRLGYLLIALVVVAAVIFIPTSVSAAAPFIGRMDAVDTIATAFPANGDLDAHGIAVIPHTAGDLVKGNILVSHFNNSQNLPGTGTTIVQISPNGETRLFAQIDPSALPGTCEGGIGLTGLVVLKTGWVIAGSLPTADGRLDTASPGCLIVLNRSGKVVETIQNKLINGPWDMTLDEGGFTSALFVSNVLNGPVVDDGVIVRQGTVVRINLAVNEDQMPKVLMSTVVASGFGEKSDPKDFITGPTGLGIDPHGTLYVADTVANRIAAIPNPFLRLTSAGTGSTVSQGGSLHAPLGLALTPKGHILVVNGEDGNMVEVTARGSQIAVKTVDTFNPGDHNLFDLVAVRSGVYFLNDGDDALEILH